MKTNNSRSSKINSLLGNSPYQEVQSPIDEDVKKSRSQEDGTLSEQEIKRQRHQESKKTRVHETKTSRHQETKKSRVVDTGGIVRRPENITLRVDFYKAIRRMAIDKGTQAWLLIDEALANYLKKEGVDVYHSI